MPLPPWTVEAIRRGAGEIARQVGERESVAELKNTATRVAAQLPGRARAKVDELLRSVEQKTEPIRAAWVSTPPGPAAVLNGSGRLDDPAGSGVPIAAEVLAAGLPLLSLSASAEESARVAARRSIGQQLGLPIDAIIVANSPSAALMRLDRTRRIGGEQTRRWGGRPGRWLIPRCCLGDGEGPDLADWIESCCRGSIREIGTSAGLTPEALTAAAERVGGPARLIHEAGCLGDDVLAAAAGLNLQTIAILTSGRLIGGVDGAEPSARSLLAAADPPTAVLVAGGVMSGTPPVGIAIVPGSERETSVRESAMDAPAAQTAMVAAAMRLAASGTLPVDQLVAVSIDNLQSRADRLATQLQAADAVSSVRITDRPAMLPRVRGGGNDRPIESRQVVVTLAEGATLSAERLRAGSPSILTRVVDGDLAIDLRYLTPEGQAQLAAAFS